MIFLPVISHAQTLNPFKEDFKLSFCNGPALPGGAPAGYVPCDFNGLMGQVQLLINAMIILGLLCAIGGFSYAGFLYISGEQAKITHAKEILRKTVVGLLIMLGSWAIVYQLLTWLVKDSTGVKALLGA